MCDIFAPTAMLIAGAASAAIGVATQSQAADAQNKAIGQQLQQSYDQNATATAAEENDRLRAARKEQARIKVAAGESGLQLSGSIEQMLMDSQMQTTMANQRTLTNNQMADQSAAAQANSMYSQVQKPSGLGAGLQIGMSALNGFNQGEAIKLSRPDTSQKAAAKAGTAGA